MIFIHTLIVSIGASHDGAVWEHVDIHMRALAVESNRFDHRWHRTADHHLPAIKIHQCKLMSTTMVKYSKKDYFKLHLDILRNVPIYK